VCDDPTRPSRCGIDARLDVVLHPRAPEVMRDPACHPDGCAGTVPGLLEIGETRTVLSVLVEPGGSALATMEEKGTIDAPTLGLPFEDGHQLGRAPPARGASAASWHRPEDGPKRSPWWVRSVVVRPEPYAIFALARRDGRPHQIPHVDFIRTLCEFTSFLPRASASRREIPPGQPLPGVGIFTH